MSVKGISLELCAWCRRYLQLSGYRANTHCHSGLVNIRLQRVECVKEAFGSWVSNSCLVLFKLCHLVRRLTISLLRDAVYVGTSKWKSRNVKIGGVVHMLWLGETMTSSRQCLWYFCIYPIVNAALGVWCCHVKQEFQFTARVSLYMSNSKQSLELCHDSRLQFLHNTFSCIFPIHSLPQVLCQLLRCFVESRVSTYEIGADFFMRAVLSLTNFPASSCCVY